MKYLGQEANSEGVVIETKRRRREWAVIFIVGLVFLVLSWVAFRFFTFSKNLPVEHSIFFFGLVNFNIILFLFLLFMIFRNLVKSFSETEGRLVGGSLKNKLIAAFVVFSFVPTTLMFLVSVFYINNSFDKWFSEKTFSTLKSSLEVMNHYNFTAKKRNYHFAEKIAEDLEHLKPAGLSKYMKQKVDLFRIDAIEYYPNLIDQPVAVLADDLDISSVPPVSIEFRKKGIIDRSESSYSHHFNEGNLIRIIKPVTLAGHSGAIVISSYVPLSLISKLNDISAAYEEYRDSNVVSYPLKSIYLIILVLMTLVILLGATWFGFYLAKQLSIPMVLLGDAAQRLAGGDYHQVKIKSGSAEINDLVNNFNLMSANLEKSTTNLKKTLAQLDEYARYIEVILANIKTGVISVNKSGDISMINNHAVKITKIDRKLFLGKKVVDVITNPEIGIMRELLLMIKDHPSRNIQKELRLEIQGRSVPLLLNLSIMYDESKQELGRILAFDDMTMMMQAQRSAAWNEVAKRIAHEIKNPLTPISLAAQRLQRKFGHQITDQAFSECTSMIIDQVDNLKTLVNEFSNFARLPKSDPTLNRLDQTIQNSMILFEQAHKNIVFESEFDSKTPMFLFDADQMKRVFTNLLDNSIAAVEGVKGAKISCTTQYDDALKIVRITFIDNGSGIKPEMRDRIFEPYVTSKKSGTGLGLAIVKRTVEDHQGFIRALPLSPRGTKIVIELPVVVADTSLKKIVTNSNRGEGMSYE